MTENDRILRQINDLLDEGISIHDCLKRLGITSDDYMNILENFYQEILHYHANVIVEIANSGISANNKICLDDAYNYADFYVYDCC